MALVVGHATLLPENSRVFLYCMSTPRQERDGLMIGGRGGGRAIDRKYATSGFIFWGVGEEEVILSNLIACCRKKMKERN
jgi:hypothetical protein